MHRRRGAPVEEHGAALLVLLRGEEAGDEGRQHAVWGAGAAAGEENRLMKIIKYSEKFVNKPKRE